MVARSYNSPVDELAAKLISYERRIASLERAANGNSTPWTAVTFQNGWVNYGGVYQTAQYRRVGDIVYLRGFIAGGTINAAAFTLLAGFRPPAYMHFSAVSAGAGHDGLCYVEASGAVTPAFGSNTWFSLEGIFFSVTA